MMRFTPSRSYWTAGLVAFVLAIVSVWFALRWMPATVAVVLFAASGCLLLILARRPAIEIHPHHLRVGNRSVPWSDIRRVDRTGWVSPLVVYLTLADQSRMTVIFPGDLDSANALLQHLRRAAHNAFIDGVAYRDFWREGPERQAGRAGGGKAVAPAKYPLLLEEDEAEVERLYRRLKAVGHLDSKEEN